MLPGSDRRYLALHLPHWATDCLERAEPALRRTPLALVEKERNALRLAALNARAAALGLYPGQSLSDARAQVPGLEARAIDRARLEAQFADFADWHSYASPIVAVHADRAPYGDLVLDIAGVAHLFGGEAEMLARLTGRIEALGFTVAGAVAGSIGAAWALAHFLPGTVLDDDPAPALANLPVAALRLADEQVEGLMRLGLKRVGDLYRRDRKALQARFGASLVLRLDQALGCVAERPVPRLPVVERFCERRFAEPIGLIDDVLMVARDLAIALSGRLEAEGLGAQSFHLMLYRVDHKVIALSVNAARPTRDAGHIARLFQHRAERLADEYDAGFGIDMIRLGAGTVSPLAARQIGAFEAPDAAADLDRLYDRMASRLGPEAVSRIKPVDTHLPERSVVLEPVLARTPDEAASAPEPAGKRPLRLLPVPEPIEVMLAEVPDGPPPGMVWRRVKYRFVKTAGPERIGMEWWRFASPLASSRDGEAPAPETYDDAARSRDYFTAEDDGGRRFWLFREGLYRPGEQPRWFLHGFFA